MITQINLKEHKRVSFCIIFPGSLVPLNEGNTFSQFETFKKLFHINNFDLKNYTTEKLSNVGVWTFPRPNSGKRRILL